MIIVKVLLVLMAAWIGSFWPSGWTMLLLLIAFSVMCFGAAFDGMVVTRRATRA